MSPPEGPHNLLQEKTQVEKNLFIIMNIYVVHHVQGCRKYLLTKYIFSFKKKEREIYIYSRFPRHVSLCHTGGSKCLTPQLVMRVHWHNMTTNLSTYHQPINLRNIIWKYNQISPKQTDLMIDALQLHLWVFEIILSKSVVNQTTHMIWDGSKCACPQLRAPATYFKRKPKWKNIFL